jgi:hypothetical protein
VATRALNPTDQLLHVCVHGAEWNPTPSFRWVADAVTIVNTAQPEIDWDRLITQTQKRRLVLPLRDTLSYLQGPVNAPVPPAVLGELHDMPVSKVERMEHKTRIYPRGLMGDLPKDWFLYLRYSQPENNTGLQPQLAGFPRYLQHLWMMDHLWQVPLHVVSKGMRMIWAAMTRPGDGKATA